MAADVLLGLDVGSVRIGVALARSDIRIASPLIALPNQPDVYADVLALVRQHDAVAVVVGWPRGLEGQTTAQTEYAEAFAKTLRQYLEVPVYLQDEALTSQKAETELAARKRSFTKADVDALSAVYILEDYLAAIPERHDHV